MGIGAAAPITELAPGVTTEALQEGKIVRYIIKTAHRESIDKWVAHVDRVMGEWDQNRPCLLLYEVSDTPLTPYIRSATQGIAEKYANLRGRTAVVVKKTVLTQLVRFFIDSFLARRHHIRERKMFFSNDEALAWLETLLK